ncbi:MAG: Ig-like domain-containing protein [ANME-2 cluster archaeon]|nr:Ig-like domain-containing protein [ANME-2 cluster archaeon]
MCLNGVNCGFSRKRCFVAYETHNVRFNTSDYPDGTYTISAEAVDLANNTGFDNISVLVDNTLPVVNVTSPLDGVFVKETVAINADILEANTASVYVTVDGILISETVPVEWDTSLYPDGDHIISVYVTDTARNDAVDSVSVIVDNTPPTVVITSLVDGSAIRDIVGITSGVYDSYLENITLAINGTVVSDTGSYIWNTTEYTEGWYRITVKVNDIVGNYGEDEILVEVDNTPPLLIVNELTENPTLNKPEYSLFILTDSDATVIVNDEVITLINGSTVYSQNVHEGNNTFEITAIDASGNTADWNIIRLIVLTHWIWIQIVLRHPRMKVTTVFLMIKKIMMEIYYQATLKCNLERIHFQMILMGTDL